jgi:hypothetical protein
MVERTVVHIGCYAALVAVEFGRMIDSLTAAPGKSAMKTLADLIPEATEQGRVCPQPSQWHQVWELLPDRCRVGGGWNPPLPLILGAWNYTSNAEKRDRFHLHLRWAAERGALDAVASFLDTFKPEDWHTES